MTSDSRPIPSLAVVVPCYNEEAVLGTTLKTLQELRAHLIETGKVTPASRLYMVDNGSTDETWDQLSHAARTLPEVTAVKLTRNRGHQNGLHAGLTATREDVIVSIDADLQDDPANIESMIDEYMAGSEIVYGVRSERDSDTFGKRTSAEGFYRLMRRMGVDLVFNHADFRLMSRKALNALLNEYPERSLFLRGLVRDLGFRSSTVEYVRRERQAGESKYPLRSMLTLAWQGITAFSAMPLRAITVLGLLASFFSLGVIVWVLAVRLFGDSAVPGWASVLLPLLFIGSVQLLALGVIGEYLAKLYDEVKGRPRYHVEQVLEQVPPASVPRPRPAALRSGEMEG